MLWPAVIVKTWVCPPGIEVPVEPEVGEVKIGDKAWLKRKPGDPEPRNSKMFSAEEFRAFMLPPPRLITVNDPVRPDEASKVIPVSVPSEESNWFQVRV